MIPTPFMIIWKRPEVVLPLNGKNYQFLVLSKVKIQGHYQVNENIVMQYHFFGDFKHWKTFVAVALLIKHSCYEIQN